MLAVTLHSAIAQTLCGVAADVVIEELFAAPTLIAGFAAADLGLRLVGRLFVGAELARLVLGLLVAVDGVHWQKRLGLA